MDARFALPTYTIRRKVLKLVGGAFHVLDPAGNVILYSQQKAFKLREDIRVFTGEDMQTEVLRIAARQIVDFSAAYDVVDAANNEKVGALRRRGLKSIVRDQWVVLDANDQEIASVQEDSTGLAILRRLLGLWALLLVPQRYHFDVGGRAAGYGQENRNPFVYTVTVDFSADTEGLLDRRLGLAAGLLFAAIEGKQG